MKITVDIPNDFCAIMNESFGNRTFDKICPLFHQNSGYYDRGICKAFTFMDDYSGECYEIIRSKISYRNEHYYSMGDHANYETENIIKVKVYTFEKCNKCIKVGK